MPQPSLAELTAAAAEASGPGFTPASALRLGGVDPLGLRQLNFDLMDQVFPGLNNVARHIRPFVVVAWAWRRGKQIAEAQKLARIPVDDLRDFVDRIEVIYALSQFLRDPNADLPGKQVLANRLHMESWTFGGHAWRKRREERQYSTAFTAPINYGPALKTLGWVEPHHEHSNVLIPTAAANPALDAFEALIQDHLDHAAFSQFGSVEVTSEEARTWADDWALDSLTEAEKRFTAEVLCGERAPKNRQKGGALMLEAAAYAATSGVSKIRRAMAGAPSNFSPSIELRGALEAWRRVQVRQLFRLLLEALFHWILVELRNGPRTTDALIKAFLAQAAPDPGHANAHEWLQTRAISTAGPTTLMDRIQAAFDALPEGGLASSIVDALAFCLKEATDHGQDFERVDRLPLSRAKREAEAWGRSSTDAFLRHVFESWLLAQHVYWSVGRGLADARANGKTILRLKVVLEEGGWTLAPGASSGVPPVPTPDRLRTTLSLAQECGLVVDAFTLNN